jgi:hypothetical protein
LFYAGKAEYANQKVEDSFLMALAQGGFQVEALARLHYPEGIMIEAEHYEYEAAAQETMELLEANENVVIFEAAFLWDGYFVRTDILVKKGNHIQLIEVKAKSFDSTSKHEFLGVRGGITAGYKPYLFDLSFQKWVLSKATHRKKYTIEAFFMMADKSKTAQVNGLNQLFRVPQNGNPRTDLEVAVNSIDEIGASVLSIVNVDDIVEGIINGTYFYDEKTQRDFYSELDKLKFLYVQNRFAEWAPQLKMCKKCEFKANDEDKANGLKCGFTNCMSKLMQFQEADFDRPLASELWNFRNAETVQDKVFMDNFIERDFTFDPDAAFFSTQHRQWTQVLKQINGDNNYEVKLDLLKTTMATWKYPLHCIDFETSAVALPFNAGRRPYEQTAFQFSHHILHEDGRVEHANEYINVTPGEFPNFEFARALKKALSTDDGTIFKFATHENTILNEIILQFNESYETDKKEMVEWLKTITHSKDKSHEFWEGERDMVDLRQVVVNTYYNPHTGGSNSIKYLLPAILKSSAYLQVKYTQPIQAIDVSSKNFGGHHVWLKEGESPYANLPTLFEGWTEDMMYENISELEEIKDGGAAMTAYAKLQYTDMSKMEREEIKKRLLQYCELDTLSMVMLLEHFKEIIDGAKQ